MNDQVSMAPSPKKYQTAYNIEKPTMRANISMNRLLHVNTSGV